MFGETKRPQSLALFAYLLSWLYSKTRHDWQCINLSRMSSNIAGSQTSRRVFPAIQFFCQTSSATLLLAAAPDSGNIVCENCDGEEQPETRCQQCSRYLCKFCTEAHRRSRDTKTHTLSTLDEMRESNVPVIAETLRCPKHEDEIVKLYCKTCEETICRDCTIVDHRQHDYVFARDVSQKKKDELLQLVGDVKKRKSEISDSLAYLKEMEENLHKSNESTSQKINQYFDNLGSIVENKKNEYLEKATAVKRVKLKQLHLQREELELTLGSCDSSIEFTEQAFKNGSDVQILNLTKYMVQCLESLKKKNTEKHLPVCSDLVASASESDEHLTLCDQMKQFHFVDDYNKKPIQYTVRSPSSYTVGEKSAIIIQRKDNVTAKESRGKTAISPSFEGVAVENVSVVDNSDGSRTVRFRPTHTGDLEFIAYENGSRIFGGITRAVKKKNKPPENCRIGDRVFESGVHTWRIDIDHSDCSWGARVDINVGVIDSVTSSVVSLPCFVKPRCHESVHVNVDMVEGRLELEPSWTACVTKYDLQSKKVSPYFWSDCNKCELTVSCDDWCFVRYT